MKIVGCSSVDFTMTLLLWDLIHKYKSRGSHERASTCSKYFQQPREQPVRCYGPCRQDWCLEEGRGVMIYYSRPHAVQVSWTGTSFLGLFRRPTNQFKSTKNCLLCGRGRILSRRRILGAPCRHDQNKIGSIFMVECFGSWMFYFFPSAFVQSKSALLQGISQ